MNEGTNIGQLSEKLCTRTDSKVMMERESKSMYVTHKSMGENLKAWV